MLIVAFYYCCAEYHNAECHYAGCRNAECHFAECRGAPGSWFCPPTIQSFAVSADRVTLTLSHLDLSTWSSRDNCSSFHLEIRDEF